MAEWLLLAGSIVGGLGLFLLAIGLMTEGLKLAAGNALRTWLAQWSRSPLRGIYTGFTMTAIVQSSSAVTVASLGFVNAGLINMRQALGIVYGANIGTTMTGWLVALVGFKFNIQAFALPLIGFGMLLKLIKQQGKVASMGLALVGFGLFFVGVDTLRMAFDGIVQELDITQFKAEGVAGILTFLLVGVIMTILTQSSSASITLTITLATTGVVGLYAAGAMVIGANVGTTTTAMLASIGATANAKRVAAAQVIFNGLTAVVAFILLPILFGLLNLISEALTISTAPAVSLALFHTLFNVLGVLIIFPLNNRLADYLETCFTDTKQREISLKYLDKNIAQTPVLSINALALELEASARLLHPAFPITTSLATSDLQKMEGQIKTFDSVNRQIANFIVSVERSEAAPEVSVQLANLMRINEYLASSKKAVQHLAHLLQSRSPIGVESIDSQLKEYFATISTFIESSSDDAQISNSMLKEWIDKLNEFHDKIKALVLVSATQKHISVMQLSENLECLSTSRTFFQEWAKAFRYLTQVKQSLDDNNGHPLEPYENVTYPGA